MKTNEDRLPQAEQAMMKQAELLKKAESITAGAKEQQKIEAPLIRSIRALDLQISEKSKIIKEGESDYKKNEKQIAENKAKKEQISEKQKTILKEIEKIQAYLSVHAQDENLITQLAGIKEQVNHMESVYQDVLGKKALVQMAQKQVKKELKLYETRIKFFTDAKDQHETVCKNVVQERETLTVHLGGRLLREYRSDYQSMMQELVYRKKISDLEAEREKLEDGVPCPLCGASHHPFAQGNIPEMDEIEKKIHELSAFIEKAEHLENHIKELEHKEKKAASRMADIGKQLLQSTLEKENAEKNLKHLTGDLDSAETQFARIKASVLIGLQPFGINDFEDLGSAGSLTESNIKNILFALHNRLKKWQEYIHKKDEAEKQCNDLTSEIKQMDSIITTIGQSVKAKLENIDGWKKECDRLRKERMEKYGSKKPDEEEDRIERLVFEAENSEKAAWHSLDHVKQQVGEIKTRIVSLKENISRRNPDLEARETGFRDSLQKTGFTNEHSFLMSRLLSDERNVLAGQAARLDEKQADITNRKKDRESRLAEEREKKITES
ncbi:MAG: hypothetical protein EHJ94_08915, partial [Deltaproteobacteria bacterium]